MPDLVLEYHRLKTPIDHPDRSVTRGKLEYVTVDVSFAYLSAINQILIVSYHIHGPAVVARSAFADKAVLAAVHSEDRATLLGRLQNKLNTYAHMTTPEYAGYDHYVGRFVNGTWTELGRETVDIDGSGRAMMFRVFGSTLQGLRFELPELRDPLAMPTADGVATATDTTFASGYFGFCVRRKKDLLGYVVPVTGYLKSAGSPGPSSASALVPPFSAVAVLEVEVAGEGSEENPFRPMLSTHLVEIDRIPNAPEFLRSEHERYQLLRKRGFTDEEMRLLLGRVPQARVDLDSVTWGAFEFNEKSPVNVVIVTGDNPYRPGAIDRQKERARSRGLRALAPPKDYREAVEQYNQLKLPHWLAGKDNYAYQALGLKELEPFTIADFYYGELIEHKAHYDQLKRVPDWEMERTLTGWLEELRKVTVLRSERDKHVKKLEAVLKLGW